MPSDNSITPKAIYLEEGARWAFRENRAENQAIVYMLVDTAFCSKSGEIKMMKKTLEACTTWV